MDFDGLLERILDFRQKVSVLEPFHFFVPFFKFLLQASKDDLRTLSKFSAVQSQFIFALKLQGGGGGGGIWTMNFGLFSY